MRVNPPEADLVGDPHGGHRADAEPPMVLDGAYYAPDVPDLPAEPPASGASDAPPNVSAAPIHPWQVIAAGLIGGALIVRSGMPGAPNGAGMAGGPAGDATQGTTQTAA